MQTSKKGLDLIKEEEGFESRVYKDIAGFVTIGYGHKVTAVDDFPVSGITLEKGEQILIEDAHHVEFFLNKYLEEMHACINQNQFDALVDFGFNLGVWALNQMLHHGIAQVPIQIVRWTHANGNPVHGLEARRAK